MKKIIAILVALIFALSAFSVMGYAEGETTEIAETRLKKWLAKFEENREIYFKVFMLDGEHVNLYLKGEKWAFEVKINDFLTFKEIGDSEGNQYIFFKEIPFFYMNIGGDYYEEDNIVDEMINELYYQSGDFVRYYKKDEYYFEEYKNPETDVYTTFCFLGDELKYIGESEKAGFEVEAEILSTKVDDKDISIPRYAIESEMIVSLILLLFAMNS